jgi:hypothetical protein
MVLSPDGRKMACWARRDGKWVVIAGGKEFPGVSGYFYYQSGGRKYSLMWSPDSQHIAYYVRDDGGLVLDGEKLDNNFTPPGLMFQNIVDENRRTVGSGMMSGPQVDPSALVEAVLMRSGTKCDPFAVSLLGGNLACIKKHDGAAWMRIAGKTEGPYREIRSVLMTSAQARHYAYVVETEKGQQFAIDGALSPHVYSAIYRPAFNEDNGSLDYLAVRDGNLLSVVQPISPVPAAKPAPGR